MFGRKSDISLVRSLSKKIISRRLTYDLPVIIGSRFYEKVQHVICGMNYDIDVKTFGGSNQESID